jgi:periplasmic protein TonB
VFTRLPESNARPQRRTGGFVVSTVVHLTLIALAVQATGLTAAPRPKPDITDVVIYKTPLPARPTPLRPDVQPRPSNSSGQTIPAPPTLPLTISDSIPDTLPEPGAMKGLLDHLFDSTRGPIASHPDGMPNVAGGPPLPENLVEKAVVALPGSAVPRYPGLLQSAGVDGHVRAQFVVDTLGRVEQGTFRALESTHDLFTAAVREALVRARFSPAEAGGRKVRQLVEQTFTFSITR